MEGLHDRNSSGAIRAGAQAGGHPSSPRRPGRRVGGQDLGAFGPIAANWLKAEAAGREQGDRPEQMEIARLKAELAKAQVERDILKKAAAYFARESR